MELWILLGLAVFLLNVFLPAMLFLPQIGVGTHVGPRDQLPEPNALVGRARRSLKNHQENIIVFLALALLALVVEDTNMAQAILGAQLFVVARLAYMPLYLIGVPWIRSIAYGVGLLGCALIALAVI